VVLKGGSFPIKMVDPSPEAIARAMDLPPIVFAPRREGTVQLILGTDNKHLWPHSIAILQDPVFSLQFLKSRIGGGWLMLAQLQLAGKTGEGSQLDKAVPPVAAMLFVIACSCLVAPAHTCSTNLRKGTVEHPEALRQQRHVSGQ
jgi:hypothetical protein